MPLDQLFVPDLPELFYAAVRALKYCEPSGNQSSGSPNGVGWNTLQPALFRRKRFRPRASFPGRLRHVIRCVCYHIAANAKVG